MELIITPLRGPLIDDQEFEIVERKGLGHPDTICDALAEQLSLSLSRFYLEQFGMILHHNVDKVLLWGGSAKPSFGGGEIIAPIEIFLAGRAIREYRGVAVPIDELVIDGSRQWLCDHLNALDPERHVVLHSLIRPGSADLSASANDVAGSSASSNRMSVGFLMLLLLHSIHRTSRH